MELGPVVDIQVLGCVEGSKAVHKDILPNNDRKEHSAKPKQEHSYQTHLEVVIVLLVIEARV